MFLKRPTTPEVPKPSAVMEIPSKNTSKMMNYEDI